MVAVISPNKKNHNLKNKIKPNKMKKQGKTTKKLFCQIYDHARKLRRIDPIQFEVIYNDWKRLRTGKI